jgi:hypothetical protein
LSKNAIFFAIFFGENIFKIITSVPGPQFPQFNTNDPATQLTGVATLGTALFAGYNCFTGDCNVRVRPNVGLNYDPRTGRLAPAVAANVQVCANSNWGYAVD